MKQLLGVTKGPYRATARKVASTAYQEGYISHRTENGPGKTKQPVQTKIIGCIRSSKPGIFGQKHKMT